MREFVELREFGRIGDERVRRIEREFGRIGDERVRRIERVWQNRR